MARQLSTMTPSQQPLTGLSLRPYHFSVDEHTDTGILPTIRALTRSARPRQWTKNLAVFLPLFFSVNEAWTLNEPDTALLFAIRAIGAALVFCLVSGAVYLFNDLADADHDRAHPIKRNRPIASGALSPRLALAVALVLVLAGLSSAFALGLTFGIVVSIYILIQVVYSARLKNIALLDVFSVASGFVLRVLAGAVVIGVPISPWLYICAGLGSLFIALAKRRSELARAGDTAGDQRDALGAYTLGMLDQMIGVIATSALVSYALYTFTADNLPDNHSMTLTLPFVLYGVFRYIYLVHTHDIAESPEDILLSDAPMILAVVLWLATGAAILLLYK